MQLSDQAYPALTIPLAVPGADSANNVTMADVIGNKTDTEAGNSLYSLVHELSIENHTAKKVYPSLADGIDVVSSAANWTYGVDAEIVPTNGIIVPYHVIFIQLEACSDDGVFQLQMVYGLGDTIFTTVRYTVVGGFYGNVLINLLSSPLIPANSRIRARLASSDGLANQCTQRLSIAYR